MSGLPKLERIKTEQEKELELEIAALRAEVGRLKSEWCIMARACGNWREFPGQATSDHTHQDWAAAARALIERDEIKADRDSRYTREEIEKAGFIINRSVITEALINRIERSRSCDSSPASSGIPQSTHGCMSNKNAYAHGSSSLVPTSSTDYSSRKPQTAGTDESVPAAGAASSPSVAEGHTSISISNEICNYITKHCQVFGISIVSLDCFIQNRVESAISSANKAAREEAAGVVRRCIDIMERIQRWWAHKWDGIGDRPLAPPAVLFGLESALSAAKQFMGGEA